MSCGQIALRDMGITPEVYYASEVDKFAIAQTQLNFPDTIQLGDVRLVDPTQLGHIDLLIGNALLTSNEFCRYENSRIRRLTPTECARLQTIPEWYTWQCSETQQYKMLGNGWTVEVIKHIFSYLNK